MCKVKKIPLLVTRDTIMGKYSRNIPDKFQKNLNNGLRGDAIKRLSVLGKGEAIISEMAVWQQY